MLPVSRSAALVTYTTWKALFLREAVNRLASRRGAWLWILLEPVVHVLFVLYLFISVRMRTVGGIDASIWVMVGMQSFFMFRRTGMQTMSAVRSNLALFTYRQVRPADTVLVRAAVEGFLMILVSVVLFAGAGLFGTNIVPADPLAFLAAVGGLWLLGLGFGLNASVASELVPESLKVVGFVMRPLYLLSGVMIPVAHIPEPYRSLVMLNPVAHGLELARIAFAPYYHSIPDLSLFYVYSFALVLVFFGLSLHVRFADRMVAQ